MKKNKKYPQMPPFVASLLAALTSYVGQMAEGEKYVDGGVDQARSRGGKCGMYYGRGMKLLFESDFVLWSQKYTV